ADDLEPAADLENSRTLGRGAASASVDAGFVGLGVLAGAFGDVENDGNGGPAQLISQFPLATRQGADDLVGPGYDVHRDLVDIELFVIEAHALHLIGHASGSLQAITMSNHTPTRLDDPGEQCEINACAVLTRSSPRCCACCARSPWCPRTTRCARSRYWSSRCCRSCPRCSIACTARSAGLRSRQSGCSKPRC